MFCKECGNEIPEGAAFCGKCGKSQTLETNIVQMTKASPGRFETRVVKIEPNSEMLTIKKFEAFGWQMVNSQTVDLKDSHIERGIGGNLMSVTERETYVKLTFHRYLDHPNYKRLVELENKYDSLEYSNSEKPKQKRWPSLLGLACLILAFMSIFSYDNATIGSISAVPFAVIGIVLLVWGKKLKSEHLKKVNAWQNSSVTDYVEQSNIMEEASRLL